MITKYDDLVVEFLEKFIKDWEDVIVDTEYGLCYNCEEYVFRDTYGVNLSYGMMYMVLVYYLREFVRDWEYFAGNEMHPVGYSIGGKYEEVQLIKRTDLAVFLLEKIKEQL